MQEFIIYTIGIVTITLIGIRIFHRLKPSKEPPCNGCSGCALKEAVQCSPKKNKK